ncbi:MAG: hypothetical protein QM733_13715 [Ilumatobacteraceae bacterium]
MSTTRIPTRCSSTSCTRTRTALTAHSTSDRFKEIGKSLRDLAGGRPEARMLKPLIGKGL